MRMHWMVRDKPNQKDLKLLIERIDKVGYESALFVFGQYVPDNSILVANALGEDQKIKLMFAIRPHAITPMLMANMVSAYEKIAPGRYVFNIVSGTFDDETLFDSVASRDERKIYCGEFIQKVRQYVTCKNFPEVAFSGSSDITINNVIKYGDMIVLHMADYLRNIERIKPIPKKKMARAWILVAETDELATEILEKFIEEEKEREQVILGSFETVVKKIEELESYGVTDLLISNFKGIAQEDVHQMVIRYLGSRQN